MILYLKHENKIEKAYRQVSMYQYTIIQKKKDKLKHKTINISLIKMDYV